ncbi:MAG: PIN domain-containing protein [Oxalobacteraceae bacterium]|jgi:predicted nucleic acid-binding protein|nr:PIN domain-containing protein [Oxalobacteraceae bacterium]
MTEAHRFFDTNLLLYLFSSSPEKADTVETLLSEGGTISVQVLNEFSAVARRKLQMTFAEISETVDTLTQTLKVVPLTLDIHRLGLQLAERYGYSVYDAMILAAALESGCKQLLTEDLQHQQCVESTLDIINPFNR